MAAPRNSGTAWTWGPYAITAACAGAGWVLHEASGGTGLAIACGLLLVPALVAGVAYARGRYLLGVDRRLEVVYVTGCLVALAGWTGATGLGSWPHAALVAVAVVGVGAGWAAYAWRKWTPHLSVATGVAAAVLAGVVLNPAADPNPVRWVIAWAAATSVAAVPWWRHRRNHHTYAPTIDVAPLSTAIAKHLRHAVVVVPGTLNVGERGRYSIRYLLADGRNVRHVQAILDAVEGELGWRPGSMHVEGSRTRRNEVTVTVVPEEPQTADLERPEPPRSITQPTPLGRHDTGQPMAVSIYDEDGARGGLIGGQKGAGKTRAIWTLMDGWTHTDDAVFMFGDLSGGATSAPWLPCLLWRETDAARVKTMIRALDAAATYRAGQLERLGWESWCPSPSHPAIVFVLDEAQVLLKDDYETRTQVEQLIQRDRKSAISVFVSCPAPVVMEGVSRTLREQARIRLCFRSPGAAASYVLGDTLAAPISWQVGEFQQPGQVLGVAPGLAALPGRTYDTPLAQAKATAVRNAGLRPALDAGTEQTMRRVAGQVFPTVALAVLGEAWTSDDDEAVREVAERHDDEALRAKVRAMAEGPGVLGQAWPEQPAVPEIPKHRLTTPQALGVAGELLRSEKGTTPGEIARYTGRTRQQAHRILNRWMDAGVAVQTAEGRYVLRTVDATM